MSADMEGSRFFLEIIEYAVCLYFGFCLRLSDVVDQLAQCKIIVSHETGIVGSIVWPPSWVNRIQGNAEVGAI